MAALKPCGTHSPSRHVTCRKLSLTRSEALNSVLGALESIKAGMVDAPAAQNLITMKITKKFPATERGRHLGARVEAQLTLATDARANMPKYEVCTGATVCWKLKTRKWYFDDRFAMSSGTHHPDYLYKCVPIPPVWIALVIWPCGAQSM